MTEPVDLKALAETALQGARDALVETGAFVTQAMILREQTMEQYLLLFRNDEEKVAMRAMLHRKCREEPTVALITIADAWWIRKAKPEGGEPKYPGEFPPPSLDPERREALIVTVMTRNAVFSRVQPYRREAQGIAWEPCEEFSTAAADSEWNPWGRLA